MKLTREIVERALKQHDKLTKLGVQNTAQFDWYDGDMIGHELRYDYREHSKEVML